MVAARGVFGQPLSYPLCGSPSLQDGAEDAAVAVVTTFHTGCDPGRHGRHLLPTVGCRGASERVVKVRPCWWVHQAPRIRLFLEDQELVVLHDAVSVVGDLLEDGLVGLALEDDVLLHQGLGAAPHCDAIGPEGMDPVLYYLSVGPGQQLQPTAPVADDVVFNDNGAVTLGDDAMASVVIDAVAPELYLALGLDLDPTLAVAGDAVVGHTGELAALSHSDASVPISMDHVGDDMQRLAALDVESRGSIVINAV